MNLAFASLASTFLATCPHALHSVRAHPVAHTRTRAHHGCRFASARPAYSVTCPPGLTPNPLATVVTAYMHTPSKHSTDVYMQHIQKFFKLQASIVAFIDYAYVHTAQRASSRPKDTIIVPVTFAHFRALACGLSVWQRQHAVDVEQNIHSPMLYSVWTEKATMVAQVARADCFGSRLFVWLDVGYFAEMAVPDGPFPTPRGASLVPAGAVMLLVVDTESLQRVADTHYTANRTQVAGVGHTENIVTLAAGGIAGDADAVMEWEAAYARMLDKYRAHNWFAGKEQNLHASMCVQESTLCLLHDSEGRWYDMVPLLAGDAHIRAWRPASVGGESM